MNVLCVVAHPDDEVLGCGATLAKHADNGDQVNVIILAHRDLYQEARAAGKILGYGEYDIAAIDWPDQKLDTIPICDISWKIEDITLGIGGKRIPHIVYTHNYDDLNLDHSITARAVLTAFRPCVSKATILTFETISSTEWSPKPFEPNWFETFDHKPLNKKIDALECYPSELRESPHPRNGEGVIVQARFRGAQCGAEYAEAFRLIRAVR